MARAIHVDGIDWLGEPTGFAHEVTNDWSTPIRFTRADGTGSGVVGRIAMRRDEIDEATEEQYIQALQEALRH